MAKKLATKRNIIIGVVALVVLIGGYFLVRGGSKSPYQFVTVKKGTITDTVSVTGNTTPVKSLDLAFENGGTIAAVNADVGNTVSAGEVIARLDTRDLAAQLAQAQANVDAENAKLDSLRVGPTPQAVQVAQAQDASAKQTLANTYSGVPNTLSDAYAKANDAVRNQLSSFFSNAESNSPRLTFPLSDSQLANNVQFERIKASSELAAWQSSLVTLNATPQNASIEKALADGTTYLAFFKTLVSDAAAAVIDATNLNASSTATYKLDATDAENEVNAALTEVNTAGQNIASGKANVAQLDAQLAQTLAGSTAQDIAAQQAQVAQAQANAQAIQVKIAKASLVSPIDGVITVQNAKVGEIAAPGAVVTSIISGNNLEVDAQVPETDIGKVSVGNSVTITFDAFPGETFSGKVFYIDPAQTLVSGVVDYKIKVSFDKADPRIKSGLTSNLVVDTQTKNDALILPQFAVLQNDQGTFVEVLEGGKVAQVPVTLGIRDDQGNVEITNGVTEGEQVINVGMK